MSTEPKPETAEAKPEVKAIQVKRPSLSGATISELAAFAKASPDQAGEFMYDLIKFKTDAFPGTVFVRREEGFLKRVQTTMPLSEAAGELVCIKKAKAKSGNYPAVVAKYDIAAAGYLKLNQMAGIHVITPETVVVGEQRQPNPFIQVSPKSGHPNMVLIRCIAVGPVPATGNLVATDVILRFDLNLYLLENFLAKIKFDENTKNPAGMMGTEDQKPSPTDQPWKFLPIGDMGMGAWINMSSPAIQGALAEHLTRVKFAERLAQSIGKRNALKAHPAMPATVPPVHNGVAHVRVIAWTRSDDRADIEQIRQLVQLDRLEEVAEVQRIHVEPVDMVEQAPVVDAAVEDIKDEQKPDEDGDDEVNPPDFGNKKQAQEAKPDPTLPLLERAQTWYARRVNTIGVRKAKKELGDLGISALAEASEDQLKKYLEGTS